MSGLNQQARVMAHVQTERSATTEIEIARVYLGQALRDLRDGETLDAITMIEGALVRLGGML